MNPKIQKKVTRADTLTQNVRAWTTKKTQPVDERF